MLQGLSRHVLLKMPRLHILVASEYRRALVRVEELFFIAAFLSSRFRGEIPQDYDVNRMQTDPM